MKVFAQHALSQRPATVAVPELNQVVYLGFRQLEWGNGPYKLWPFCEMINQCVRRERQDNLRSRQLCKNAVNQIEFHL
jgi:hypothetical protein